MLRQNRCMWIWNVIRVYSEEILSISRIYDLFQQNVIDLILLGGRNNHKRSGWSVGWGMVDKERMQVVDLGLSAQIADKLGPRMWSKRGGYSSADLSKRQAKDAQTVQNSANTYLSLTNFWKHVLNKFNPN